jgi:ABC-2 type transport system permease protein
MTGSIFMETMRRNWRAMLIWGIGIASMAAYIIVVIPDMKTLQSYSALLKSLPPVLVNAMGGDSASMATPGGFLAYGFFGWIMLVMATWGVLAGLSLTANEEDRGIMDILLSLPLARWRIIIEKFLAQLVILIVILLISFAVLAWGTQQTEVLRSIPFDRIAGSTFNFLPATLFVLTLTALLSVVVRRRATAVMLSAIIVIASWFVDTIGRSAPSTDALRSISFFRYYDSSGVMQNGLVPAHVIGLLVVSALMLIASVWFFQRRDVGV